MAILQARRQYNARNPNGITRIDPVKPPPIDPHEPVPVVQPPVRPAPVDRAMARQNAMNNYMQRMGMQGYRYGAGNVRTGNTSVGGATAPGYTALTPGAPPVAATTPQSGSPLRPVPMSRAAGVAEPTLPQDPRNGTGGGGGLGAI